MNPEAPLMHRAPSVGAIVKQILAINPDLNVNEITGLIRRASHARGETAGDYASQEVVDEQQVLELARETLHPKPLHPNP